MKCSFEAVLKVGSAVCQCCGQRSFRSEANINKITRRSPVRLDLSIVQNDCDQLRQLYRGLVETGD